MSVPVGLIRRQALAITLCAAAASLTACGDDGATAVVPQPPRGIVVLDGFIQPGLTLVPDSGSATSRIAFAPPTEFDAGGFTLERDTVLAVSSKAAGDLLYIADLKTATVRRVQAPARSNPGRARLFTNGGGQARIAVTLRDSSAVALFSVGAQGATSTRITGVGACPSDVFQYDNAVWVVDANSACRSDYAVQGDVRLIRIPNSGTSRDTLIVTGLRGSAAAVVVIGDVAYVSAGGDANFGAFPFTLRTSGAIAKVDLRNRRVLTTRPMPVGSYGAGLKRGGDGFLYVSVYENLSTFADRLLKLRTDDLSVVSAGTTLWLSLIGTDGKPVTCASGVADALGRVHCLASGAGSTTSLLVFSPLGTELRRVPAGQGGVDLALR